MQEDNAQIELEFTDYNKIMLLMIIALILAGILGYYIGSISMYNKILEVI